MPFKNKTKKEEDDMKVKKIFLMMVVAFSMVALFAINIYAAQWYTCTVVMAGPGYGSTYVLLTDKNRTFTNRWFRALSTQQKEILATALTAMTNNVKVKVGLDDSTAYSSIRAMYLMQQ